MSNVFSSTALKIKVTSYSEKPVSNYQSTRHHIPEYCCFRLQRY